MHQDKPLISVIIPSFNRVDLIAETLDSVKIQTYTNWECIIVDDGSKDGTQVLIKNYEIQDSRFRFIQRNREPKGAPVCRNIGLENSKGKYVIFLDSDDLLANNCLENRISFASKNPNNDFWVFKTGQFISYPGDSSAVWNILNKEIDDLQRFILQDAPWHTMGSLWLKSTLLGIGGFDESAICWQDWELHIRAILKNLKYWKSSDENIDSFYRNNKLNKSNTISADQNKLEHIIFRIDLFNSFYKKVTIKDPQIEIKNAFAVLYYRLYCELHNYKSSFRLNPFLKSLKKKGLYTFIELIILQLLSVNLLNKKNENRKFKYMTKLLGRINSEKFDNKVNSTFQN